jgi:hypothetical protein
MKQGGIEKYKKTKIAKVGSNIFKGKG